MIGQVLNRILVRAGQRAVSRQRSAVLAQLAEHRAATDEDLRRRCRSLLDGATEPHSRVAPSGPLERLAGYVLGLVFRPQHTPEVAGTLALAAECFARAPADLPAGARLYPQQIDAALALTQGALVEMETGEGKTYAILPAAFALACTRFRVYVLCANSYLAWRDASRTRPFWEFVGVQVGFCDEETPGSVEWSRRVVYTTLRGLVFKSLQDDVQSSAPLRPLTFGALILDEADAILLDQTTEPYQLVTPVSSAALDWRFALEHAATLVEERDVEVDRAALSAALTVEGSERLRSRLGATDEQLGRFLLARYAVELAYVATRVTAEGVDFVVDAGHVRVVDRVSGRIDPYRQADWLIPLAFARGLDVSPKTVVLHRTSPITVVNQFAHVSGTSGTIVDEALEYAVNHGLYATRVEPRFPRQGQVEGEVVWGSRELARRHVCQLALGALAGRRPVLIGTQRIDDAEHVLRALQGMVDPSVNLRLLTGRNENDAATTFEAAGRPGSITIATQLAGRGVDIRLTPDAKASGGMALICLGHGVEPRLDRQFLGRVGRHGDPFSAAWVSSLDDPLILTFLSPARRRWLEGLFDQEEPVEHALIAKSLRTAQHRFRYRRFLSRSYETVKSVTEADIMRSVRSWFEYLQLPAAGPGALAGDFIQRVVDHFVAHHVRALLEVKEVDRETAEAVASTVATALGVGTADGLLSANEVEGLGGAAARKVVADRLQRSLGTALGDGNGAGRTSMRSVDLDALSWVCGQLLDDAAGERSSDGGAGAGDVRAAGDDRASGPPAGPDVATGSLTSLLDFIDDHGPAGGLKAEVLELARAARLPAPDPAAGAGVRDRLTTVKARIDHLLGEADRASRLSARTPREIARWSLLHAWMGFLEEKARIEHRGWRQGYAEHEAFRVISDRVSREWAKREGDVSRIVLQYLLKARRPEELDDLFYLEDHKAFVPRPLTPAYAWSPAESAALARHDLEAQTRALIEEFVALRVQELTGSLTKAGGRRLLADFTRASPLYSLQSPRRIQHELEQWTSLEIERGVSGERRKLHRTWLREFLLFLRDRRLIGPLPRLAERLRSRIDRYVRSLAEPRSLAVGAGGLAFVAMLAAGLVWGDVLPPRSLSGVSRFLDVLVFGGLLADGNLLAPLMGPLLIGAGLLRASARPGFTPMLGTGFDRFVVPALQVAVAAWMVWGGGRQETGITGHLSAAGWFLLALAVATVGRSVVWTIQNRTGIDLTQGWLCLTIVMALPVLWSPGAEPWRLGLAFLIVAALVAASGATNHATVDLVSTRVASARALDEGEEIAISWKVPGQGGAGAHVFGFVLAWFVVEHLGAGRAIARLGPLAPHAAAMGVYYVVAAGWTRSVLGLRLSPGPWRERLNSMRLVVPDAADPAVLRDRLQTLCSRLARREALALAVVMGAAFVLLHGRTLPGTGLPLALVAVAAGALFALSLERFARDVHGVLLARGAPADRFVDFALPAEPAEPQTFWDRVREAGRSRLALALTVLIVVVKLIEFLVEALKLWRGAGQ